MTPDMRITIENLRELARHGDAWPSTRLKMSLYADNETLSYDLNPEDTAGLNECGTSCCLIGIAAANKMTGIGKGRDLYCWDDYGDWLFPALRSFDWADLFGTGLPNVMKERTNGLRDHADYLESAA